MTIFKVMTETWGDVPVEVEIKADKVHCHVPISFQGTTDQSLKDFEAMFCSRSQFYMHSLTDLQHSANRHVYMYLHII